MPGKLELLGHASKVNHNPADEAGLELAKLFDVKRVPKFEPWVQSTPDEKVVHFIAGVSSQREHLAVFERDCVDVDGNGDRDDHRGSSKLNVVVVDPREPGMSTVACARTRTRTRIYICTPVHQHHHY